MTYLGRNQAGQLVHQPNSTDLKIGVPATGEFHYIIANSGATLPAFDVLNVNPNGVSQLATISGGRWMAEVVSAQYGGTGKGSYTQGDILYAVSATGLTTLPSGAEGQRLSITLGALAWVNTSVAPVSIETTPTVNLVNSDYFVAVSGEGNVTVNLPASPANIGQRHIIKDRRGIAASSGITISGNGNVIDGTASTSLSANYQVATVIWDGWQWNTV